MDGGSCYSVVLFSCICSWLGLGLGGLFIAYILIPVLFSIMITNFNWRQVYTSGRLINTQSTFYLSGILT